MMNNGKSYIFFFFTFVFCIIAHSYAPFFLLVHAFLPLITLMSCMSNDALCLLALSFVPTVIYTLCSTLTLACREDQHVNWAVHSWPYTSLCEIYLTWPIMNFNILCFDNNFYSHISKYKFSQYCFTPLRYNCMSDYSPPETHKSKRVPECYQSAK